MNKNSYITIQSWMREDLGLSGNELMTYAVVYGFSQDGESRFTGSRQYIADWCGCTTRSVQTVLNNLTERGLLTKYEYTTNNIKHCEYVANFTSGEKFSPPSEKISPPSEKFSLNNIDNIITDNIDEDIIEDNTSDPQTDFESHSYSNEDLRTEFLGSVKKKKRTKRKSLYEKCVDEIQRYTKNIVLQSALTEYLSVRLAMKDKPIYGVNQWIGLLNRLSEVSDESVLDSSIEKRLAIVKRSTERGWGSFFPLNSTNKDVFSEGEGVHCESATDTEEERIDRLNSSGRRTKF
jgi:hypothetical protein